MEDSPPLYARIMGLGVSKSYSSELASGRREPSKDLAIRIFRGIGVKLGPIKNATDEEIDVLERMAARDGKAA